MTIPEAPSGRPTFGRWSSNRSGAPYPNQIHGEVLQSPFRSATVGYSALATIPPDAIGARTETGVPLSGPEAFFDLDQPVFEELGSDPVFAPVKDGLLPESAALVGASAIGAKVLVPAIEAMPAAAIFDTCEGAVRWLMHRKLMYGDADGIAAWFTEQVWSAEWRATAVEAGAEATPEK